MSTPTTPPESGGTDTVVVVGGEDWDEVVTAAAEAQPGERIVVNMGPQHPSTHGVLRLILEIEGETITEARCGIGYLHTGIEKNLEYRTWTQGVTFVTRMDYLSPLFNETVYCLGVEKLLGVTDDIPERATVIRVMMMELNRISSPPGRAGHRRDGAGLHGRDVLRVPRARADPVDLRDDHRAADEQLLRPARRGGDGPARGRHPADPRHAHADAEAVEGPRRPAQRELHLEGPHPGHRLSGPGRMHGTRHHRPGAALHRTPARPARGAAVLRVRDLRFRRHHRRRMRRVWPVPDQGQGDARVAEDHRAVRREAREVGRRTREHRGQEAGLARRPEAGARRAGQLTGAHREDHGPLDGGVDPPLQARHRGHPGPARTGLRRGGVAARRARRAHGLRRRHPALPGALPRPVVHEPAGGGRHVRGRHGRRRHLRGRVHRPGDGRR